jgi:hypothetical protein
MPRIRSIKPQFWLDENLGKISRDARLLYIGLWNLSDDTGVFEWRPARIKIQIFPYDTDVTEEIIIKWLDLLSNTHDIYKFSVNGNAFGYIPTFLKHQDIKKPSKWKFADIPDELLTIHPLITNNLPTSMELDGDESLSSSPREKEKEKVIGSKFKVIGIKEKESSYTASLSVYKDDIKIDYPEFDLDVEIKKCATWWAEGKKPLKRPKTALNNWMIRAKEIKNNGTYQENNKDNKGQSSDDPNKFTKGKYGSVVQQ